MCSTSYACVNSYFLSVAAENSVCLLGDCPPHGGELATHEALTPPAVCGASCGNHPTCAAWMTLTNPSHSLCYIFRTCPAEPIIDHVRANNKRIYTCYPSKCYQSTSVTPVSVTNLHLLPQ